MTPSKKQFILQGCRYGFQVYDGHGPRVFIGNKFIFRGNVSGRAKRSSQQLNIPLFKTKKGQRSFSYRIVNIWNNLPSEVKLSQCLNSFKRNLRKYLLKDFLR